MIRADAVAEIPLLCVDIHTIDPYHEIWRGGHVPLINLHDTNRRRHEQNRRGISATVSVLIMIHVNAIGCLAEMHLS
jgi:hypothetical protein